MIARFSRYPDIAEKIRLLQLLDILVVNCDSNFHLQLTEQGFFETLISDKKVTAFVAPAYHVILLNLRRFKVTSLSEPLYRRTSPPGSAVYREKQKKLLVMYSSGFWTPRKENPRTANLEVRILVGPRTNS